MKSKKLFGGLIALAIGGVLLFLGVKGYRSSKQLVNQGQSIDAQVADKDISYGRKNRKSYYVSVAFKTPAGQEVKERLSVDSSEYSAATVGGTIPVRYLASDPTVCQVGDQTRVPWVNLIAGVILAFSGGGSMFSSGGSSDDDAETDGTGSTDATNSGDVAAADDADEQDADDDDDDMEMAA
jgi:hypothetical protein